MRSTVNITLQGSMFRTIEDRKAIAYMPQLWLFAFEPHGKMIGRLWGKSQNKIAFAMEK